MFAVWVIYDTAVFCSQSEFIRREPRGTTNVQSLLEEPTTYMIAPSSASHTDQLALVGDWLECLQELSRPVLTSTGIDTNDCLRFFCGDKPAQQFGRGT